ncbi:MAG: 50S ribosomal protein L29 [Solirubrobacterales bacterium]|nr:50S ribosomal protein L29 [Solirubrobacterales bacterium]
MKAAEVHGMKDDELVERVRETREEQFNLRFQHATGELEDTTKVRALRRDVARLLTVAKQRGIDLDAELRHP